MPLSPAPGPVQHREHHRIAIRWGNGEAKVCQLQFGRDGFFVHFPYHPDSPGVAGRYVLPPQKSQNTVDLTASGLVTSHKVKYSHHIDGTCHFSQDGKIVTSVRNASRPLRQQVGHVFTLYVQGLARFAEPKQSDPIEVFEVGNAGAPSVVRIVGRWFKLEIAAHVQNPVQLHLPPNYVGPGIACCPPPGSPFDGCAIVLEAFQMPQFDANPPFILAFTAGFGVDLMDLSKESSFLAVQYPLADPHQMPSMDFVGRPDEEPQESVATDNT